MVMRIWAAIAGVMMLGAVAPGGVLVRVEVSEAPRPAATQPATGPVAAETIKAIETVADGRGHFRARTRIGKEVIELKGKIAPAEHGQQRVNVDYSDRSEAGLEGVKTSIELPFDKAYPIGGMNAQADSRQIILTLEKAGGK